MISVCLAHELSTIEDVSINNEFEYENDFQPYLYSKYKYSVTSIKYKDP